jgi:hypothetical protein
VDEKNAVITSATITNADHGCLSAWIYLDYGGTCQGFGGYALYLPKSFTHHGGSNICGHFIWRVLEIAGVDRWEDLIGKTIRVRAEHSSIEAVGHIIKDIWFNPSVEFKEMEP